MNTARAILLVVVAAFFALAPACAAAEDEHVPVPYAPEEFPAWTRDLRRAEIVFLGSLPFSFFFTFEAYDTGKFIASGFDPLQAPWPMRSGAQIAASYSTEEKAWLIASALTVSAVVAVVDYLLVHRRPKREDR